MIAHSFSGEMFGPAQSMHGATFVVDARFYATTLDKNNVVIDIGAAHAALKSVLEPLNYKNLDEVPKFAGQNTTTEFLCKYIWDELATAANAGQLGRNPEELVAIKISLHESHVAKASYKSALHNS